MQMEEYIGKEKYPEIKPQKEFAKIVDYYKEKQIQLLGEFVVHRAGRFVDGRTGRSRSDGEVGERLELRQEVEVLNDRIVEIFAEIGVEVQRIERITLIRPLGLFIRYLLDVFRSGRRKIFSYWLSC